MHAELYALDAVEESAAAFAELATITVEPPSEGPMIHVEVRDMREDVRDRLVDELYNHALEGTILRRQSRDG